LILSCFLNICNLRSLNWIIAFYILCFIPINLIWIPFFYISMHLITFFSFLSILWRSHSIDKVFRIYLSIHYNYRIIIILIIHIYIFYFFIVKCSKFSWYLIIII
jgi:hypothetical protein